MFDPLSMAAGALIISCIALVVYVMARWAVADELDARNRKRR